MDEFRATATPLAVYLPFSTCVFDSLTDHQIMIFVIVLILNPVAIRWIKLAMWNPLRLSRTHGPVFEHLLVALDRGNCMGLHGSRRYQHTPSSASPHFGSPSRKTQPQRNAPSLEADE
ncbi:hypothetical protein MGYG_04706 [Nannizzia gypsea CBS 118893]|uniref:Uncharacterized protein n=1 Tax=Arthroderma gypseum (strain ATCC MYA-4604 / CBS 118893) TaxID=535722 RepID=E4UW95_ARTGP|nr:hypothetical protein MGYG_04706 [Nannizzia gypsea CBS 118893]EFR01703.1 hypothetical protein MGYG_04706 [Nannizzia gypsea CBS 118893]